MASKLETIEQEARSLSDHDKAALARTLIASLDGAPDDNVEAAWLEEAEQRYKAFLAGTTEATPGDEAMERARKRLK